MDDNSDVYITTGEMRNIIALCDKMDELWEAERTSDVKLPEDFWHFLVYDSNGDALGTIGIGDLNFAFYPNVRE